MIDGDCESCWQSDKSLNGTQTINLTLEQPTQLSGISIQFQGGFAANQIQFVAKEILKKIRILFLKMCKKCVFDECKMGAKESLDW